MNLSEFEKSFNELQSDLRHWLQTERTYFNLLLYDNYVSYSFDISRIINRIENELQISKNAEKELFRLIRERDKNSDVLNNLAEIVAEDWTLLHLDIKSFFVFTQVFLYTLAGIIRYIYGMRGEQPPQNMTDVLTSEKAMELDAEFFENLRKKIVWYTDFNDK